MIITITPNFLEILPLSSQKDPKFLSNYPNQNLNHIPFHKQLVRETTE